MEEQNVQTTTQRPQFLTVLCILSYIGCGLAIIGGLMSIGKISGIINLLAALICLYGVLQMWKLKKMGFYLYLIGEITPMIVGIATLGFAGIFSFGGGFFAIIAGLMMIFPVLFIILYGLNFKHLQ
jgi:hypothetical protein